MAFKVAGSLPVWVALGGWLWISGRPGEAARAVLPVAIVFLGSIPVFRCPSHWSDISGHAFLYMLAITPFALVRRPDALVQGLGWLLASHPTGSFLSSPSAVSDRAIVYYGHACQSQHTRHNLLH